MSLSGRFNWLAASTLLPAMGFVLMDAGDMRRTLGRMAHEILEANGGAEDLVVVGVLRRGWPIAKRLAFLMTQIEGTTIPCAKLDITAYRDDRPSVITDDTEIPFDLNDKRVVLVDEVLYTGRTVRAALDALMKHGRPKEVQLAVLIDRGHRELPIAPTYCGKTVVTEKTDHVTVRVNEYDGEDAVLLNKPSNPAEPTPSESGSA
jgi:pyrimidine operon attenuation protein/uracil phosphoribosyltransferase